jgi:integrase
LIRRAPKIKLLPEKELSLRLDDEAERKVLTGAAKCNWRQRTLELFLDIVILVRDIGMRNEKELYQIRVENIDWDRQLIFVPDSKTVTGIRDVPMSDRALNLLRIRCGSRQACEQLIASESWTPLANRHTGRRSAMRPKITHASCGPSSRSSATSWEAIRPKGCNLWVDFRLRS